MFHAPLSSGPLQWSPVVVRTLWCAVVVWLCIWAGTAHGQTPPEAPEPVAEFQPESFGDEDHTLNNALLLTWSTAALVGGPASIYLIADGVTPDQATLLSLACAGGVVSIGLGGALLGVSAILLVFSPFVAFVDGEAAGQMALAALASGLLGFGLVALSPVIIGVGTYGAENRYGDRPENVITLSLATTLAAGVSGVATVYMVDHIPADGWAKALTVGTTSLLMANITYATIRRISEEDETPAMVMSPLIRF
ncbi:MAG: hypothetical protein AAFX99_31710 [Myxococcota bacterium]